MSEIPHSDFERFLAERWTLGHQVVSRLAAGLQYLINRNKRYSTVLARHGRRLGLGLPRLPIVFGRRAKNLCYGYVGKEAMLFHWGTGKLRARYLLALKRSGHRVIEGPEETSGGSSMSQGIQDRLREV